VLEGTRRRGYWRASSAKPASAGIARIGPQDRTTG
jgi:hypothetical protein